MQVFSEDQTKVYATILAIPNYRLQVTGKTVMTFGESAVGVPQAIRAWFYPGANSGEEFVYPKKRAMELAKAANLPILAMPAELETAITRPAVKADDEPIVALKGAPVSAVNATGEEVDLGQVVTTAPPPQQPLPAQATPATPAPTLPEPAATADSERQTRGDRSASLPQTASLVPLVGLLGVLSLSVGFALWFMKRKA